MRPGTDSEKKFFHELQRRVKLVLLYEDLNLLNYALEQIPVEELSIKATEKLSLLEHESQNVSFEDLLLLELLQWFKFSFFSWVDAPECDLCHAPTKKVGMAAPVDVEIYWGANRVEHYFCEPCDNYVRFPRYNHPKKLLETRKGRCGEWANCFTLLCRSLGYEARLVADWSDHIWTEVFSHTQNKWLHCDPCENICDKPLIYELGWKKVISYIIAFSKDEIQDVTWRYAQNFEAALQNRNLVREEWLLSSVIQITHVLQKNLSPERKAELQHRRAMELADFLTPPMANDASFGGRTSGSLAWRMARGEYNEPSSSSHVFYLNPQEIEQKTFHIKYSCALDKYIRISDNSAEKEKWESFAFDHNSIFRKVENDWNVVYLSRKENCPLGLITWKFNFKETGLIIETLKLHFGCRTFENGMIKWLLSSDVEESCTKVYQPEEVSSLVSRDFRGSTGLTISAELSGGSGQIAWQHAQLFRQPLDSKEFPFEVEISLTSSS